MRSERIQQRIDRFLQQTEGALDQLDWAMARELARTALALDPENADAATYLAAAERMLLDSTASSPRREATRPSLPAEEVTGEGRPAEPKSFVAGRYQVVRFLGEGGKKRVYLAQPALARALALRESHR